MNRPKRSRDAFATFFQSLVQKRFQFFAVRRRSHGFIFRRPPPSPRCTKTTQTTSIRILVPPPCSTTSEPHIVLPRSIAATTLKSVQKSIYRKRSCSIISVRSVSILQLCHELHLTLSANRILPNTVPQPLATTPVETRVRILAGAGPKPTF